jgi:starvation-inducible DNA-binding protein
MLDLCKRLERIRKGILISINISLCYIAKLVQTPFRLRISMEINNGISEQNRMAISEGLSRLLADTYSLYLKTQNFHWNVRGQEFYSLHLLFEKQYQEMADAVDEVAERIRALGFYVEASFSSFKGKSAIQEEEKVLNAKDMLHSLIQGHETLARGVRKVAEIADKEKDFATVDMIGRRLGVHEKMVWFLRSQL